MRSRRSVFTLVALLAIVAGACTPAAAKPGWTYSPGDGGDGAAASPSASGGTTGNGEIAGTLDLDAVDIAFKPSQLEVEAAGRYKVNLHNTGAIAHDITFPDGTAATAQPGETATVEVDVPAAGISFICSVPGHKEAGMEGLINIKGSTGEGNGNGHGGPAPETDVQPDPNAPAYTLFDPRAPALLKGATHDIELVMEEKPMTVAPGFVQQVWTFGGTVPGPVIRVKVGDTIRVTLKNPAEATVSHSIDFHSSQVAWNDEMRSIAPGEELVYEWTAEYAGVWMYHCGTAPTLHHIANGMYGMVIVEPREGLPPVDAEFAMVQSEWYLGPQRQPVSLTKAAAAAPAPDFVVFNGVANQYAENPIQVGTGDRVRVFVLNAGPSVDSSFHVVGTIFSSVTKEGIHLVPGNEGSWGSQAVDLSPAQGAIVEMVMPEDGQYPMVTHAFNFVGRGALGLFQAGDGDPTN
ncbi:MAG TPA: multicopper oxidase domain-containing protein [Candidatus Limnocylindrales bacterium]|nr:multicopper oxidase domain-containing protein [Candidatus Limnocylindrales bacterium]